ncbi:class I SAM-dependent methyltransferase [Natrinema altunense]|uniref:Methyltransferase type 11 n=1 Tax=Natrinema altunense (strain JCM 12890 / CGMCC 1.3731 / AJ2) TaxID=1227494 RepID=L9ZDC8_NATA2|nr:class I SAM-dependent methyltransferase [Natrinema altunense]ELY83592.1 Methyltransferase type 11 [Natrinema altunense JCM 12890]
MNSNEVRRQWAERTGAYSPEYYAHYGPDKRSEAVRSRLERFVGRDAAVLELGCSSGRHLAHLHDHGFEDLHGIDVNDDAFDVMAETYPDLAADGTFYHDTIEAVVGDFADDRFDAVYSVETLQHLHPDAEWVLEELTRITADLLVTVENEGESDQSQSAEPDVSYVNDDFPLYHRNWNRVFTELGLREVDAESGTRDTVRAFRRSRD